MNKKGGKVFRIKPFNMTNFSGAGGYIPVVALAGSIVSFPVNMANFSGAGEAISVVALAGSIVSFPATMLLWIGFAATIKEKDGRLDFEILESKLKRILLPICCVSMVPWLVVMLAGLPGNSRNPASWIPAILWVVYLHNIGVYTAIHTSAKKLNEKDCLSTAMWFRSTFIHGAVIAIVGFFISALLVGFGS